MGKDKHYDNRDDNRNKHHGDNRDTRENREKEFKLHDDVKEFGKMTIKKFKKKSGAFDTKDCSKKEKKEIRKALNLAYNEYLLERLPSVISTFVWYGNKPAVAEAKNDVLTNLCSEDFIKMLRKCIKDECSIKNIEILPALIYNIILDVNRAAKSNAVDIEASEVPQVADIVEISAMILKDKIKKLIKKGGCSAAAAFDAASVIPDASILKRSPYYHLRRLMTTLYDHAADADANINFGKVVKILCVDDNKDEKDDDREFSAIYMMALLEKKQTLNKFTSDKQRDLFNQITSWVFQEIEEMSKENIKKFLESYVISRRNDDKTNRDENRRYRLIDVPAETYPKIAKAVTKLIENDEQNKKYFM